MVEYANIYFIVIDTSNYERDKKGENIRHLLKGVKKYNNLMHRIQYQFNLLKVGRYHFAPGTATDKRPHAPLFKRDTKSSPKLNPHPRGWTLLERQWIGSNTGDTMPKYGKVKARADEYKHEGDDSLVTANNS